MPFPTLNLIDFEPVPMNKPALPTNIGPQFEAQLRELMQTLALHINKECDVLHNGLTKVQVNQLVINLNLENRIQAYLNSFFGAK